MTIKALYPTVRPTLNLDFAKTKTLDPRVTFSRASTGTFVGSNGLIQTAASGAPRFDHNPATGESLGLLVEEARTNLVTYSEQFDDANWTKPSTTVTANATTAPDGTLTADRLLETAVTSTFYVGAFYFTPTPGTYTVSVYAKGDGSGRLLNMTFYNGVYLQSYFNLSTGVVSNVAAGLTASIQSFPNGWFRCSVTGNYDAFLSILLYSAVAAGDNSVNIARAGSASAGFYLWGCQGEAGAFPTSYIPTTTAAVTRAADIASITGTNFSSWYRQDEGTLYAKALNKSTAEMYIASINDSSLFNQSLVIYQPNSSQTVLFSRTSSGVQAQITVTGAINAFNKFAGCYKTNDFAFSVNSGTVGTDTSGAIPISTTFDIGAQRLGVGMSGTIARLAYYPVRLPDAQLQALTAT